MGEHITQLFHGVCCPAEMRPLTGCVTEVAQWCATSIGRKSFGSAQMPILPNSRTLAAHSMLVHRHYPSFAISLLILLDANTQVTHYRLAAACYYHYGDCDKFVVVLVKKLQQYWHSSHYFTSVVPSLPWSTFELVQCVENAAARTIFQLGKRETASNSCCQLASE